MDRRGAHWIAAAVSMLVGVLVLMAPVANAQSGSMVFVEHRLLILTQPGWTLIDFLETTIKGYGIPYDVIVFDGSPTANFAQMLRTPSGTGAYSGIIMFPGLDTQGLMTRQQVMDLQQYQASTTARIVRFGAWPWNWGVTPVDAAFCTNATQTASFSPGAPLGVSGILPTAKLNVSGLYRCPGLTAPLSPTCANYANDFVTTGIISPCNQTVVMTYDAAPELGGPYTQPTVAAVLVTFNASTPFRRDELVFTMSCASWQMSCMVLSHFALTWLLHDIIPGQRHTLLSAQIDDVFLDTELLPEDVQLAYRANLSDYHAHVAWQRTLNAGLPPGSDVRLDLVYNGNGILELSTDTAVLDIGTGECDNSALYTQLNCTCKLGLVYYETCTATNWCKNCTKNWKMPPGSGANLIASTYSSSQWQGAPAILSKSDIANAFATNLTLKNSFLWTSHTFTHQNLDNATNFDSRNQWQLNKDMAAKVLQLSAANNYSQLGVVTPQISGLSNVNNLQALTSLGYKVSVGDNTWPYLVPANPYHMLRTTQAMSNFGNWLIIGRYATEIYFNAATRQGNLGLYNRLYTAFYGRASSFDELLDREATRVARDALLALRHDPFMFHQANLARLDGPKSLVAQWVDAVLQRLTSFVNWPVQTIGMDALLQKYQTREQRDACQLSYQLLVNTATGKVERIMAYSKSNLNSLLANGTSVTTACTVPIMFPSTASVTATGMVDGPAAGAGVSSKVVNVMCGGTPVVMTASNLNWV